MTVLVTRLFGYADQGALSLAMSVSAAFQTLALFGIRTYQVSDIECKYPDSCYVGLRGITCAAALAACLVFDAINLYELSLSMSITLFMLFRLSESYSDVLHGIVQKNNRLDIAGKGYALKGILLLGGFLAGYFLGLSLNACLLIMTAAVWCVTLLFDMQMAKRIKEFKLLHSFKEYIALGKNTAPLCLFAFLNSSLSIIPKYILEKMTDKTTLGGYSSIFAPALIIQAAASYIYAPFIGTFTRLYSEKKLKETRKLAFKIMLALTAVFLVCLAGAAILGEWGLSLVFGETILPYVYLLLPIIIATFCVSVVAFLNMLLTVMRDFKSLLISGLLGFAGCCVSTPLMIRAFGINGASFGMITGAVIGIIYTFAAVAIRLAKPKKD